MPASNKNEVELAAERLIKLAGSKHAAITAVNASKAKGRRGRPKGTEKYLQRDLDLLLAADLLQDGYRHQQPLTSRSEPKRRPLLSQIVPKDAKRAGLGETKEAVVARLAKRDSPARILINAIRQNRPDLARLLPTDADARLDDIEEGPHKGPNLGTILFALMGAIGMQGREGVIAMEASGDNPETES